MSSCSGPDCNHSSHDSPLPAVVPTADQISAKIHADKKEADADKPEVPVRCKKCTKIESVSVEAVKAGPIIHGNCGGDMEPSIQWLEEQKKIQEQMVNAPPWAVFSKAERIPLKGFWFKVVGYTQKFEVVLQCVGATKKNRK